MPKKKVTLPKEINDLVKEVKNKGSTKKSVKKKTVKKVSKPRSTSVKKVESKIVWDVPKDAEIEYFDANLSYELTGYRPINATLGLDFDPDWFTEARDTYNRTGHYTEYLRGTKAFADYWREQYRRCKYGMTVNGYTVTGDHYFFLNFYLLKDLVNVESGGGGRKEIFPNFLEGQYEWFHYLMLAKKLKMNACMMKAREAGFSEIEASIMANSYNCIKGSINVATAFADNLLSKLLDKVWDCLSFLNNNTDGGFFKSRLVIDSNTFKRASQYKMINGQKVEVGWKSQVQGIIADKPGKMRGDRTDLLVFEEAGLNPVLTKTYTQSDALVGQIGRQWGYRVVGGTSGETGAAVEGLRKMYYHPRIFGILQYKHNFTLTGETTISSFFLPAFRTVKDFSILDHRGWCSDEDGKKVFDPTRELKKSDPIEYQTYCAEYCYNAEEAFSLEGDNKFNKIRIAEQLAEIRAMKRGPKIEKGFLEYTYRDGVHNEQNISGFKWIEDKRGAIQIVEHPLWTLPEKKDEDGKVIWTPPSEKIRHLYVIGIDGIDIGAAQTSLATRDPSDFCLTVYKRSFGIQEPQFVALYYDRPNDVREAYKIALKMALYYNAIINIEATRQGLIPFARERKLLSLFMKRPRATLSESMRNNNKQFGTPATLPIIAHQTDLIADYVNDHCHMIWFDEMLDELNRYSDDNRTKFDIVASMAMSLLADEELLGTVPKTVQIIKDDWEDIGYYTDEEGHRRYGVVPKRQQHSFTFNNTMEYDDFGIRTSNPRVYQGLL